MVEVIGFIVSLMALLYLFVKQSVPAKKVRHPEKLRKAEGVEADFLGNLLRKESEEGLAEKLYLPVSLPSPSSSRPPKSRPPAKNPMPAKIPVQSYEEYRMASQTEGSRVKNASERRRAAVKFTVEREMHGQISPLLGLSLDKDIEARPSRAKVAVDRLSCRRDLLIYQEIIDKPKSLRPLL